MLTELLHSFQRKNAPCLPRLNKAQENEGDLNEGWLPTGAS